MDCKQKAPKDKAEPMHLVGAQFVADVCTSCGGAERAFLHGLPRLRDAVLREPERREEAAELHGA